MLVLEPGELTRVGLMQYHQTLPLADKEVGSTLTTVRCRAIQPNPRHPCRAVREGDILIGKMARAYPAAVRRIYDEGHTIGTHTEDHPIRLQKASRKRWEEIDDGIADVGTALGEPRIGAVFPHPGLERFDIIEED